MLKQRVFKLASALAVTAGTLSGSAQAADAICYNCPPQWADWGTQLKVIKEELGYSIPFDNKNSGQTLSQLLAEQNNPVADVAYYGVSFGITAAEKGVTEAYKPANWDQIPEGLKDPDGEWFTIHSGTIGLFVNVDALDGKPVPTSWQDLLDPTYKGMIGYLDPSSAFVGYAGAVAINGALGGDLENFEPGLDYFAKLKQNNPIVPKQTAYSRVLSGEIPIMLDYDFNAYRAKYKDGANIQFVIPEEGSVVVPYVMSLVKNSPNPDKGRKILDFVLSDKGQSVWANAFLRPVRPDAMPEAVKAKFLPASEYARAKPVDYKKMAEVQGDFQKRYLDQMN
ncbi:ABC transporter substrate-binding protein [Marinobacterium stanieri]|uniref:Putative spermidine/putrescine transport system substrate-binding protein n=1 Tax=Marinobacterium stanieri TaxID=49186 RepID=A0A1N6NP83_9GAMM|nr:ABC transporter substrate-binding protein [Marinobacterium stanieri]SIP93901.1 putative spermidine/putrescine transport system substrate-binding protein [Marinobacterium stanieri]